jgi:hypothetical protein
MSDTQALLDRIAALRRRLETASASAREARASTVAALPDPSGWHLGRLNEEREFGLSLDEVLRPMEAPAPTPRVLPRQLTARARRVVEQGRELLHALRHLGAGSPCTRPGGTLAGLYRETSAITETALRLVQFLPDSVSGQMHLCEGLEAIFAAVAQKLQALTTAVRLRQEEDSRIEHLADLLQRVHAGEPLGLTPFVQVAEVILHEVEQGVPLRFLDQPAPEGIVNQSWVARAVACHALTLAPLVARLIRLDGNLRGRALDAVLCALLMDVGMLSVSPAIYFSPQVLDDEGRRQVEAHAPGGAARLRELAPEAGWLAEAALNHHERLDGTGYPDGVGEMSLHPLVRLLAVADVYAALAAARAYRPALQRRTALTEVLLLAEKGLLDGQQAERLLSLGFYPPGCVVEMADGALARVIAAGRQPARPVVLVLADNRGKLLPQPHPIDLSECEGHSIVRELSDRERRELFALRYPSLAY